MHTNKLKISGVVAAISSASTLMIIFACIGVLVVVSWARSWTAWGGRRDRTPPAADSTSSRSTNSRTRRNLFSDPPSPIVTRSVSRRMREAANSTTLTMLPETSANSLEVTTVRFNPTELLEQLEADLGDVHSDLCWQHFVHYQNQRIMSGRGHHDRQQLLMDWRDYQDSYHRNHQEDCDHQ